MRKYYVVYSWRSTDENTDIDFAFLMGDPDNMEETIMNWYKELRSKTSDEIEACLTIINWKAL